MPRAPFQVLVYPYRPTSTGGYEYCLFVRADNKLWQGIAGGGEQGETPLQAAMRETREETGLAGDATFIPLDSIESIPVTVFRDSPLWGEDVYVIPQYSFAVTAPNLAITLSDEHDSYAWFSYQQAIATLRYDGDKTALWELNQRLTGLGPRG